jgi:hypothetical protein
MNVFSSLSRGRARSVWRYADFVDMPSWSVSPTYTSCVRWLAVVFLMVVVARCYMRPVGAASVTPSISSSGVRVLLPGNLSRLGCHGGGGCAAILGAGAPGIDREARFRSLSTEALIAKVICGRRRPLRAAVLSWHYSLFFL